jgi:hypothetical protein
VPRLYLDPKRAFGGMLNDAEARLAYYRGVLAKAQNDPLPDIEQESASFSSPCEMLGCWEPCR